jgi:hypothetical protein
MINFNKMKRITKILKFNILSQKMVYQLMKMIMLINIINLIINKSNQINIIKMITK